MRNATVVPTELIMRVKREGLAHMLLCTSNPEYSALADIKRAGEKEILNMLQKQLSQQADQIVALLKDHFGTKKIRGIELGTLSGMTFMHIVRECENVDLIAIDSNPQHGEWTARMTGFEDRSMLIVARTDEAIKQWRRMNMGQVDFVWIDAAHDYEQVKRDIANWAPLVKHGGIVGGHDYSDGETDGVGRAVREAYGDKIQQGGDFTWWVYK